MLFLATTWWIWLIVTLLLAVGAVLLQLRNMRNMFDGGNIFTGFIPVAVCGVLAMGTGVCFIIGAIAQLFFFIQGMQG